MHQNSRDIYHTRVSQGVALAWVNSYSAVVVKTPGATLLFDPVSLEVPEDASLDLIAVSHAHLDHWDQRLVAGLRQRTRAIVATPPFLADRLDGALPHKEAGTNVPGAGADGGLGFSQREGPPASSRVTPLQPGEELKVGDAAITALRCDHAAVEPLAFLVRTADGVTVYLPGDTTPFPEMGQLPGHPLPDPLSLGERDSRQARVTVDVLLWMGTNLYDGARIAQLVQPKVMVTYSIAPPAAGARARGILTTLTPDLPFHALERHQVFSYPSGLPEAV